jgi:hypothetical protein
MMLTDFGEMLKKLMIDADISQGQLAKSLSGNKPGWT